MEGKGSWKRGGGCAVVSGGVGKERMVGVGMPWADQVEEVLDRCFRHLLGVWSVLGLKRLSSEEARLRLVGEAGEVG